MERITQVVEVVASGKVLSPTTIDLDKRHIDYHKQAARVLHLLADDGTLLPAGATLVTLPEDRRRTHLAIQFEVSVCGRAWLKWARVSHVAELDPNSAEEFLRERSALDKESMIKRRGRSALLAAALAGCAGGVETVGASSSSSGSAEASGARGGPYTGVNAPLVGFVLAGR